jgi:hypothetical protein
MIHYLVKVTEDLEIIVKSVERFQDNGWIKCIRIKNTNKKLY